MWIHVVAGLAIGGAFIYLWNSAAWEWILIGLIALLFFLIAGGLDRSSYAVLRRDRPFPLLVVLRREVDRRRSLQPDHRGCARSGFTSGLR